MILKNNSDDAIIVSDHEVREMSISQDAEVQAHIIKVLTDHSYQRKIESVVREAVANAIDSNIEANKEQEPVYVRLKPNSMGRWYFEVQDQGLGLDLQGFDRYIMGIGESTKRNNPKTFGYYGGGAKAPLCKVNSFDWICRKDGVERKMNIYKTTTVPGRNVVYERPTTEPDGCIVHIDLPYGENILAWKNAMREQLAYLPNIIYDVSGEDWNEYEIFSAPDFELRELTQDKPLHISLGGIYYPIDWAAMGRSSYYGINVPIALKFTLQDGIQPTFSREALQYNETTRKLIEDKIQTVTQWLVERYNQQVQTFETFREAFVHIDNKEKRLDIEDFSLILTPLLNHTDMKVEEPRVKNVATENLVFYKKNVNDFDVEYYVTCQTSHSYPKWLKEKRLSTNIVNRILEGNKVVKLREGARGNFKNFLKDHFGKNVQYVVHSRNISLFPSEDEGSVSYHSLLKLEEVPKEDWRQRIQEWQYVRDSLLSEVVDGTRLPESVEFKSYLERKREQERMSRQGRESSSKSIGKTKGDITIGYLRKALHKQKLTADKEAIPIATLYRLPFLHVYFIKDEYLQYEQQILRIDPHFPRLRFVLLNPTEIKYVQSLKNFKTYEEFMKSRPFSRIISAYMVQKLLDDVPENVEMIYTAFPKFKEIQTRLETYYEENKHKLSDELAEDMIRLANEKKLWDMTIHTDYIQFKRILKEFSFLKYFQDTDGWRTDEEEKRVIRTMIYIFMRDRKVTGNAVEDYELVPKAHMVEFNESEAA